MMDKRLRPRISFCASYEFSFDNHRIEGKVLDISMGGALLHVDSIASLSLKKEGNLTIYLRLGEEEVAIPTRGYVVRLSKGGESNMSLPTCAVCFSSLESEPSMELYRAMRLQCFYEHHNTLIGGECETV